MNGLHGGLVLSAKAHAKLVSVDASEALKMPGVVGFYAAKDVPGSNEIGAAAHDEEVFATEKVTCVGQVGLLVIVDGYSLEKGRTLFLLGVVKFKERTLICLCPSVRSGSGLEVD
jgi:xanthine dehydrogenase/oxidase